MQMYVYGWWIWLMALPPAAGLFVWLWLSPSARHLLGRADPRCLLERRLVRLRLDNRISTTEYQRAMARLAAQTPQHPTRYPTRHG